ncbi:MAG: PepSY-associated TM helix domain-containing protein [Chitinophagaceae bacterium]
MKVFFRRIHLYLSLAAGLVILIACLTGAILVFEKEAQMALNHDRYFVEAGTQKLSLQQLEKAVKETYPGAKVNGIKIYTDAERSTEVSVTLKKKEEAKAAAPGERAPSYTVFINPYNAQVLDLYTYRETFFYQVFALHRWLLGGQNSIGKTIVGVATLIFLFILITGIILWFPATKRIMMQRLKIKWTAGWKRLNHDFHIVLGFYSAIFLFIFAFTGLAWSFEWFNKGIYTVTNSPMKAPEPPQSAYLPDAKKIGFDAALSAAKSQYPDVQFYNISAPKDSTGIYSIAALSNSPVHENATDAVYVDQFSGNVLGTLPFDQRSLGAQVRSSFKPVHTGSIWGTPSKIIAFITCLLGVTFPITGTIMWINRIRKKKKVAAREKVKAVAGTV